MSCSEKFIRGTLALNAAHEFLQWLPIAMCSCLSLSRSYIYPPLIPALPRLICRSQSWIHLNLVGPEWLRAEVWQQACCCCSNYPIRIHWVQPHELFQIIYAFLIRCGCWPETGPRGKLHTGFLHSCSWVAVSHDKTLFCYRQIFENWNVMTGMIVHQRQNNSRQIFLQLNRYVWCPLVDPRDKNDVISADVTRFKLPNEHALYLKSPHHSWFVFCCIISCRFHVGFRLFRNRSQFPLLLTPVQLLKKNWRT